MSAKKLPPCSTRYYLNRRHRHQGISLLKNILIWEKKYSSVCTKKEKNYRVFKYGTDIEKIQTSEDKVQRESAQKGRCYVEECADTNVTP